MFKKGQIINSKELVEKMGTEKQIAKYNQTNKLQKSAKDSLLKNLSLYCEYKEVKVGRSINYEILEVYSEPRVKEEKRGGNNSIYQEDFINIMVYNLYHQPERCKLLSKSYLSKMANLVNSNYTTCKRNIKYLSDILEIEEDDVYSFYNDNQKKLSSIVERGLNACRRRSILTYNSVTVVAKKEVRFIYNELGEPILKNNNPVFEIVHIHRIAEDNELEVILNVEQTVKEKMFNNKNIDNKNIFLKGKWSEYKKEIKIEINKRNLNMDYYYEAYELNWVEENIEEIYKKEKRKYKKSSDNINKNYIDSVEKTIESNSKKNKGIYSKENYIANQMMLSKTLIDEKAKYLGNDEELRIKAELKKKGGIEVNE